MIYLDNAATSFPKPESVYSAVLKTMQEDCGNPGRGDHRLAITAGRIIDECRLLCSQLFRAPSPDNIIFTNNTTTALNIAIKGILKPGDHVISSNMEHNSASRPLQYIEGITISKLPIDMNEGLSVQGIDKALRPDTKLVVCSHISNVTGTVNDIAAIGSYCRNNGLIFLVDAAQSAGVHSIDVKHVDLLAFPGHKGLLGPQGTGGLYVGPGLNLKTILEGGTGSQSESLMQPEDGPSKFESGTPNTPGLAGLSAGIRYIFEQGIDNIRGKETALTNRLLEGIRGIKGVRLIGPGIRYTRGSIVSIVFDKISPAEAALMMDSSFEIAVRSGLHCAADAQAALGTLTRGGTLRISPSSFNTNEDIDKCLEAIEVCAAGFY